MSAINERVSAERLNTIKSWREAYGQDANVMIPASEAEAIISELQQYRAAAEPIYQVRDWHWYDTEKCLYDEALARGDECRVLYAAPQVTSVPDEHYRQLSDLYHAQEKRLFKLAQRIKGLAFDKYAYSPSQAIDVLESAIFGEREEDGSACRAAMLNSAPAVPAKQLSGNTEQVEPVSAANKLGGWIPVSDRLPEAAITVLISNGADIGKAYWLDEWGYDFAGDKVPGDVTHWMPLPNPPTKQEAKRHGGE